MNEYNKMKLRCPECRNSLQWDKTQSSCQSCKREFPIKDGILFLYTDAIRTRIEAGSTAKGDNPGPAVLAHKVALANIEFHDQVADEYDVDISTAGLRNKPALRRLTRALSFLKEKSGGSFLLDIGCGTGAGLVIARDMFKNTLGVDISPKMLEHAQRKQLDVCLGSCYQLPLSDNTVDAAVSLSVLHHLPDPENLIIEAIRVLKPGGHLYIDFEPNHNAYQAIAKSFYQKIPFVNRCISGEKRYESDGKKKETYKLAEYGHTFQTGLDPRSLKEKVRRKIAVDFDIYYVDENSFDEPYKISATMFLFYLANFTFNCIRKPEFGRYFALLIKKR